MSTRTEEAEEPCPLAHDADLRSGGERLSWIHDEHSHEPVIDGRGVLLHDVRIHLHLSRDCTISEPTNAKTETRTSEVLVRGG